MNGYSYLMLTWLLEKERFDIMVKDRYVIFSITHLAMIVAVVLLAGIVVLWFKTGIMWFRPAE